jgi:large subunit ribosomal protein L29
VKGVQAKDLRGNDSEELRRTLRKLEEDLFKNRLKKNTNQLENTMLIRSARRDIARVNTVLAERLRQDATAGKGSGEGKKAAKQAEEKET